MILAVWFLVTHIVLSTAEVPDICETSSAPNDFINSYPPIQDVCSLAASLSGNLSLSGSQSFLVSSRATNKYQPNNPTVLVTPLNTADIQKVVRFVDKFNIQLVVSSSGMDLFGRTSGNDTLHLDMSKMDDINVNRNDQSVESGISATMGPGVVTVNAYKHLDTFGLVMSGGWCPGVAMAGFVAGGGTGPLTRYYGYGADNVLSATLVTANGTILYVDHQEISATYLDGSTAQVKDPELFRALRGGVGGTYGIITEYKYTLYEAPQTLWVTFNVPMYNSAGDDYGKKCLVKYFEWLVSLEHVDEIGGLVSLSHQSNMPGRGLIRVFMFHYGDLEEGYRIVKPVTDYCKPYSFRNDIQYKNYTHWGGFGSTLDWKYNQDFTYPVSRFLQLDDLKANGEAKSVVMKIVEAYFETNIWMCTIEVTGGKGKRYTDHASTSISPGFRSSDAELICFSKNLEASTKKTTHDFATQHVYPHGEGIHPNEADFDLEDWHVHAWGSQKNYDRLLDVKRRYDPGQLFKCSYCVGAKEHEREFYRMQLL